MNAAELAGLRDRVARARLQQAAENKRGWPDARLQAGADALAALRAATAPAPSATPPPPDVGVGTDEGKGETGPRRPKTTTKPCVYCGSPTGRNVNPAACDAHKDLPAKDPYYQA